MSRVIAVGIRSIAATIAVSLLALAIPRVGMAQASREATALSVAAPSTATLGEQVAVRAVLRDTTGQPIAGAAVFLASSETFLNVSDNVALAWGTTDARGAVDLEYEVRRSGRFSLQVEFRGDERRAPSKASALLVVEQATRQLYAEHAGVEIPGLNAPPPVGPAIAGTSPSGLSALWPRMSVWPIALALLVVWALYAFVASRVFRIAAASSTAVAETGRSPGRAGEPSGSESQR